MPYWFDGNNLIGQSVESAQRDGKTQRAFLTQLSQYARLRGGRFVVFFDGDDADRIAPPHGVSVRYSAPLSADDSIGRRLGEAGKPAEVIVVTNDLDLQRRCRNIGAKAINWREFASRMNLTDKSRQAQGKEERVDVEEWMNYFGLDEDSLD